MNVVLHNAQADIFKDKHRFRVVCAGRRFGKSVLAQVITLDWCLKQSGLYWIVSPTYKQSKMIHWRQLNQIIPKAWISKKNEVELSLTLQNGAVIELKGAENPDALRGVKLRGLVIDEIASIRNWDWLWSEVLRPTLTDYSAPALFISTPKGYNHFYELYELGQRGKSDYSSYRFTSYENNSQPTEEERKAFQREIDTAKRELTEDTFAQEYLADFRKHTGLVYKEFDRQIHVIEPFEIPESWTIYRGLDFGSTNPTVCLWIGIDGDDNWFVVAEHYETGQTIDYHAGIINAHDLSTHVRSTYGDPSGAQWIKEFAQRGIYITPATKETGTALANWVRFGIDKIAEKLKPQPGRIIESIPNDGGPQPQLFIFNTCVNTIREVETYRWKEKAVTQAQDLNEPDVPDKANDHAMDALRYFAVSHKKTQTNPEVIRQYNVKKRTKWAIS